MLLRASDEWQKVRRKFVCRKAAGTQQVTALYDNKRAPLYEPSAMISEANDYQMRLFVGFAGCPPRQQQSGFAMGGPKNGSRQRNRSTTSRSGS